MGIDILGSTLVALVERAPGPDGVAARGVDWYDIDGMDFRIDHSTPASSGS